MYFAIVNACYSARGRRRSIESAGVGNEWLCYALEPLGEVLSAERLASFVRWLSHSCIPPAGMRTVFPHPLTQSPSAVKSPDRLWPRMKAGLTFNPKGVRRALAAPPIGLHLIRIASHAARVAACTGLAGVLYKHHRCFNSFTFDRMTGPHGMRMNDMNYAITPGSIIKRQHVHCLP